MDLKLDEIKLLIKVYICKEVHDTGYSERDLEVNEHNIINFLESNKFIEESYWKSIRKFKIYKTTDEGSKIAQENIVTILNRSDIGLELSKIPVIFLKLLFFHTNIYNHNIDYQLNQFYWDEGILEFLREKGWEHWNTILSTFNTIGLLETPHTYVSTNGGELREKKNLLPKVEILQYIETKLGITEGLSNELLISLNEERQILLKKRENLLYDSLIEDFYPKHVKFREFNLDSRSEPSILKRTTVFMSYSTKDAEKYQIKKIAERLKRFPDINDAIFWQGDASSNIIEFMDKNLGNCDVLLLFCSPDALLSDPVKDEWTAAESLKKPIIPICTKPEHIPPLLSSRKRIEFDMFEFERFISNLHELIVQFQT